VPVDLGVSLNVESNLHHRGGYRCPPTRGTRTARPDLGGGVQTAPKLRSRRTTTAVKQVAPPGVGKERETLARASGLTPTWDAIGQIGDLTGSAGHCPTDSRRDQKLQGRSRHRIRFSAGQSVA